MSSIGYRRTRVRGRKRLLAIVACAAMTGGLLTACSSSKDGGGQNTRAQEGSVVSVEPGKSVQKSPIDTLTMGFTPAFTSVGPTAADGVGYFWIGQLSLETLLQITPDGKLKPGLATSWERTSDTEYVYHLREGVKFWDGTELTADDVVYSLYLVGGAALGKAGFYGSVDKIVAQDKYTVVVTLKHPDASWQYTPGMAYAQIFQKKFAEEHKDTFGKPGTLVMGTGPWKIVSLNPTSGAEYEANPTYWGGEPPIKHITVKFYASETSLALAMRAGEVDIAPVVGAPDSFKSASGVPVTTASTCGSSLFSMPTQTGPWADLHVRKAVAQALNKDDLLKAMGGSVIKTLDTLIPEKLLATLGDPDAAAKAIKSVPTYQFDLTKAKAEMAQSATPTGFSSTLLSLNDQNSLKISQAIVAQLKEIGINLEIKSVTQTEYYGIILGPADQRPAMFITTGGCAPDPSWDNFFLANGALNEANYHPAEMDTLVANGLSELDGAKRLDIYIQILKMLAADVPYVPIFQEGTSYASKKYDWVNFGDFWNFNVWGLNLRAKS